MTEEEREKYNQEALEHPWLNEITLNDLQMFDSLDMDLGIGVSRRLFEHRLNGHYEWLFRAAFKYFYQTGYYKSCGNGYIDSNTEWICWKIMQSYGYDDKKLIDGVLFKGEKFDFVQVGPSLCSL